MKVYLINKYDRWCPENDNGDYFIAAFSTLEKAKVYINKHDPKSEDGKRRSPDGYSYQEFELDAEE